MFNSVYFWQVLWVIQAAAFWGLWFTALAELTGGKDE